ncbi:MAG TPA: hypothetical protein VII94_05490 [Candidatus Saccharimonadales bacterium]
MMVNNFQIDRPELIKLSITILAVSLYVGYKVNVRRGVEWLRFFKYVPSLVNEGWDTVIERQEESQ